MKYALILAGGTGSRLWPLSRQAEPKQCLRLFSAKPMLEDFLIKIKKLFRKSNIYVAGNLTQGRRVKETLARFKLSSRNLFFEPEGINTFAPIALFAHRINAFDPRAIVVVSPCDNVIREEKEFLRALKEGMDIAKQGYIVTLGSLPDRPETGYGYIKVGRMNCLGVRQKNTKHRIKFYQVDKFIEKPSLGRAKKFIIDKSYYWNGGVFIFQPKVLLDEVRKFMPRAYEIIVKIDKSKNFTRLWSKLPSISIDYGLMERTNKAVCLPSSYGWLDLGSWAAISRVMKKGANGNNFKGNCLDIGSSNTLVWAGKRFIATLGLKDVIIVDSKDALLVCAKNKAQDVKRIAQKLKQMNLKELI